MNNKRMVWGITQDHINELAIKYKEKYLNDTDEKTLERIDLDILSAYMLENVAWQNDQVSGRILLIKQNINPLDKSIPFKLFHTIKISSIFEPQYNQDGYLSLWTDDKNLYGMETQEGRLTEEYMYRIVNEDRDIENLLDYILIGDEISSQKLNYYTKPLWPYAKKAYHLI